MSISNSQLEQIQHIFRLCDPENSGAITIHGYDGKILFHEFVEGCASWFSSGGDKEEELYDNQQHSNENYEHEQLLAKQQEIEQHLKKIAKYKQEITTLNSRIELQQSQLFEAEALNRELSSNLTSLQDELQKQKKDSKTISLLNRKIVTLEEEIAIEIEKYSTLKQNEVKLNNLKSKLTEEKNKLVDETLSLKEEIMKLKNINISLDSKLTSTNLLIRDKQQTEEKLKEITNENKELNQKLNDYYQLSTSVKQLTDENKKLSSLYDESRSLLSRLLNNSII